MIQSPSMSFRGRSIILAVMALLSLTVMSADRPPPVRAGVAHDLSPFSVVATADPPRTPSLTKSAEGVLFVDGRAQQNDDEPDVLLMALLTVGAAAGATVLALIGYVIRNRLGFWLHRPPPREGGAPEEHH